MPFALGGASVPGYRPTAWRPAPRPTYRLLNASGRPARGIRRLPHCAATPIVAMTANAFDDDRRACLAAGMNDHPGKPVVPEIMYETLLKWLSAGAPAAP